MAFWGWAFPEIPKESAKTLGVTRTRPFSSGAVFVNGKYVEPPYLVERWGTGIRINSIPVTGQVVDWDEFLKTQAGVRQEKSEPASAPSAPAAAPVSTAPVVTEDDDIDESSLDDLFDDDPKPKKKTKKRKRAPVRFMTSTPAAPKPTVSYVLEEKFVPNEASRALLKRINATRTEIDRQLRSGGFICFGDGYSRVVGDSSTLLRMLETLPELMQRSADLQSFVSGARAAHLVYLNENLLTQLYRNRFDYRKLQSLRAELQREVETRKMLNDISSPIF